MTMSKQELTRRTIMGMMTTAGIVIAQRHDDINVLPANLPVPLDDGACDHLVGMAIPSIPLAGTRNHMVILANVPAPRTVVYAYPRTGEPDKEPPPGWNDIPGARGCTPQSCSMRDHYKQMKALGAEVFGLSTQTTGYQKEMVNRLHLPFEVLSDSNFAFTKSLRLPTFSIAGMTLIKRLTLVIKDKKIEKVFYPIFPPDQHGAQVVAWLTVRQPA
jgi:peroxiredoxin